MAIQDISDPQAIRAAVAEYDGIGAAAFLSKYGFGRAPSCFLEIAGERYDSKAVVGAAHGYQFPEAGPLNASEFCGGEAAVARLLEGMGFVVIGSAQEVVTSSTDDAEIARTIDAGAGRKARNTKLAQYGPDEENRAGNQAAWTKAHPGELGTNNPFQRPLAYSAEHLDRARRFGEWRDANPSEPTSRNPHAWPVAEPRAHGRPSLPQGAPLFKVVDPEVRAPEVDKGEGTDAREAVEGARKVEYRRHSARERSRKLVTLKKEAALAATGALACEVCRFDFSDTYGKRGEGFIECHHTKPVETLGDGTPTKLADLALLCANCHRMIHGRRPWLSIGELRALIGAV